jgi:ribosomal protein S18 acetylase RimI-like enzyme
MNIEYIQVKDNTEKSDICNNILKSLPLWFGIPESNNEYCENVKKHDFYKIVENEKPIGFISLKENNEYVSEIYVMGILPEYHRKGIGKNLALQTIVWKKASNPARQDEIKLYS